MLQSKITLIVAPSSLALAWLCVPWCVDSGLLATECVGLGQSYQPSPAQPSPAQPRTQRPRPQLASGRHHTTAGHITPNMPAQPSSPVTSKLTSVKFTGNIATTGELDQAQL